MTKSSAQDVHANAPDGAIDAFLKKFDIVDSFGNFTAADDANKPGSMYFGDGNSDQNYHLQENKTLGIELGLKEHYRTGDDIVHNNTVSGMTSRTSTRRTAPRSSIPRTTWALPTRTAGPGISTSPS